MNMLGLSKIWIIIWPQDWMRSLNDQIWIKLYTYMYTLIDIDQSITEQTASLLTDFDLEIRRLIWPGKKIM